MNLYCNIISLADAYCQGAWRPGRRQLQWSRKKVMVAQTKMVAVVVVRGDEILDVF